MMPEKQNKQTTTTITWTKIDSDEPVEGFSQIWVMQAYGFKTSKLQEYGTQVAFAEEPNESTVEMAKSQAERFMRSEGIKGDIRYEFLTYHVEDEIIPQVEDE